MKKILIVMVLAALSGAARMYYMIKAANDSVQHATLRVPPPPPPREPTEEEKMLVKVRDQIQQVVGDDEETMYDKAKALPKGHQVIFLTIAFEQQALDAGFASYFWQHEGKHNEEIVAAMKAIGAEASLGPFVLAIHAFEDEQRQKVLGNCRITPNRERAYSRWLEESELGRYNAMYSSMNEDLDAKRAQYIHDHPEFFPRKQAPVQKPPVIGQPRVNAPSLIRTLGRK